MHHGPHDNPSEVNAEEGEVHIDGPGGVAIALSPEAAAETSDRLLHGAVQARGQQLDADDQKKRVKERTVALPENRPAADAEAEAYAETIKQVDAPQHVLRGNGLSEEEDAPDQNGAPPMPN